LAQALYFFVAIRGDEGFAAVAAPIPLASGKMRHQGTKIALRINVFQRLFGV
jgi:hypothetical protein